MIRIGTSGWNYDHWKGRYYPEHLPHGEWFSHYCRDFETVEINNTFYRLPEDRTFQQWEKQAPHGFLYAVKASRFLTHMKKLNDPQEPLTRLFHGARLLKTHLGPVLYQLPPGWKKNLERLREFARLLPKNVTHVLEFRDRSWLDEETYELMSHFELCLCVHDMLTRHPRRVTGPAVYVRYHGTGRNSGGKYSPSRLRPWADWIRESADDRDVFAYFNNDAHGYALRDARELRRLLA